MKKNNFDFLRLLFALFVIISHSYPLSGVPEIDWLAQLTNKQISFSSIGVKGFFVISGFLIFQSLLRSKNIFDYFWKRFLRLFPGLFVVLTLTVILAQFVYNNNAVSYWANKDVWKYVPYNISLFKLRYTIAGVFDNVPVKAINGSLWTIAYEFSCYVGLGALFFIRNKHTLVKTILLTCFIFLLTCDIFFPDQLSGWLHFYDLDSKYIFLVCIYFVAGSVLAAFKVFDTMSKSALQKVFWVALSLIVISLSIGVFKYFAFIFLPVLIISFGTSSSKYINQLSDKIGDLSYGVYIYAYPVQQTLVYFFKPNYLQLMFMTIPIVLILAFLSWHLVEKKFLKLKNLYLFNTAKNLRSITNEK